VFAPVVIAALGEAIQKNIRYFKLWLDSRVKPGHDIRAKFANVFMASSAGGNIGVIKLRDDGGSEGAVSLAHSGWRG
jgi:hypothetical protein